MAKKPINPYVEQLIPYAKMSGLLRQFSDVTLMSSKPYEQYEFIYMMPREESPIDRFAILRVSGDLFRGFLVNTVALGGFNKNLKKTMTVCEQKSDRTLLFTTPEKGEDGGDATFEMPFVEDETMVTSKYHKLFKDKPMTAIALASISQDDDWQTVDEEIVTELQNNQLVSILLENGEQAYITKALFGQMRKTGQIQYRTLSNEGDTSVVMFRQREEYGDIYHIARFVF